MVFVGGCQDKCRPFPPTSEQNPPEPTVLTPLLSVVDLSSFHTSSLDFRRIRSGYFPQLSVRTCRKHCGIDVHETAAMTSCQQCSIVSFMPLNVHFSIQLVVFM